MCDGGDAHQLSEVHVQPQLDFLLIFALVSVLNGLDCMCAFNDMHAKSFTCGQQHFSPCILRVSCWDGYITCTGTISSMNACSAHYCSWSCYNSSVCAASCSSFSCCFSTCKSFFIPFSNLTQPSFRTITSWPESPKFLWLSLNLLDLATLFYLYVFNNLHLAFIVFIVFVAFSMLPSSSVHDASCCDVVAWCPCLWTTWCLCE